MRTLLAAVMCAAFAALCAPLPSLASPVDATFPQLTGVMIGCPHYPGTPPSITAGSITLFPLQCDARGNLLSNSNGPTNRAILTAASPTACTTIETNTAGGLYSITNAATAAQTVTISLYDEGASPTCASADLVYSAVLGASQVVNWQCGLPLLAGLAYKLSAAATANIVVGYQ